jgi:hypothetical protein
MRSKPGLREAALALPERQPLTDEQREQIVKDNTVEGHRGDYYNPYGIMDDMEAAHNIKAAA